jgi:hypothetical protein
LHLDLYFFAFRRRNLYKSPADSTFKCITATQLVRLCVLLSCFIKDRVSIDERPSVVDERSRVGDWEIDLVIGKGHSGALLTIVEHLLGAPQFL